MESFYEFMHDVIDNETLIIVFLFISALYYNDANLALAICTGLLGYLKGGNNEAAKRTTPGSV